jgi:hypothetical protein
MDGPRAGNRTQHRLKTARPRNTTACRLRAIEISDSVFFRRYMRRYGFLNCDPLVSGRYGLLFASVIYASLSGIYFAYGLNGRFSHTYIGRGFDPTVYIWSLAWWPHAIFHHINPVITNAIWAPAGYNLAQATTMPGPAVLVFPLTGCFGPVAVHNLLVLLCPALAALAAYILCHYVCGSFWVSLFSGYIFGYSEYTLSQTGGHLVLLFIFPLPLLIYLVLRRQSGSLTRHTFLALLSSLLVFIFLSFEELFATSAAFGGAALLISFALFGHQRRSIRQVTVEIAGAYAIALLLLTPFLYYVLRSGVPHVVNPPEVYSNDLLSFVIPTRIFLITCKKLSLISRQFGMGQVERAAYLGPGLWLIFGLFVWKNWKTDVGKLLTLSFFVVAVASLGPKLHIEGVRGVSLPWAVVAKLPLLDLALPGRFGVYLFLIAALVMAIYVGRADVPPMSRAVLCVLAVIFVLPNPAVLHQRGTRVRIPAFFSSGEYSQYLRRNDIVLALPYGGASQNLLWQAATDFYFRSATGFYIPPEEYSRWPITRTFTEAVRVSGGPGELTSFLTANHVNDIIISPEDAGAWIPYLSEAGMRPILVGGIVLCRIPSRRDAALEH